MFNGRMDFTAAVIKAAKDYDVDFVTHERTWFGDGIRIIPGNNCLSIKEIRRIARELQRAINARSGGFAAKLMAMRFLGTNALEWRVYNQKRWL